MHLILRRQIKMNLTKLTATFLIVAAIGITAGGCATRAVHHSSSVVQYLYPDQRQPMEKPQIPLLSLPMRVGIAFVPETKNYNNYLTEKEKIELMAQVSRDFKKYAFVKSIDLIPSAYLTPSGSFTNLDQIRTMFGIDAIALLSFDQARFTDEGLASITYWTLIGAYIVPGEKNDTHTMVDAAVYDIKSRKMLFRAPGISHIKSKATPVNQSEQARHDSLDGFEQASKDLVKNLEIQLDLFKEKIKESPQDYQIVYKPGYTGGGSLDLFFIILLIMAGCVRLWTLRFKRG